jgi:hypothetical protein
MDFLDEAEATGLLQYVLLKTASRLGIDDVQQMTGTQLLEAIRRQDPETYRLVEGFAETYLRWYRLRSSLAKPRRQGPLTPEQQVRLADLAGHRDTAREALLRRLRAL